MRENLGNICVVMVGRGISEVVVFFFLFSLANCLCELGILCLMA